MMAYAKRTRGFRYDCLFEFPQDKCLNCAPTLQWPSPHNLYLMFLLIGDEFQVYPINVLRDDYQLGLFHNHHRNHSRRTT